MKRLYLIGFMGCGKSTLGHSLATKLGYTHIDLDFYIEQRYHDSISALFEKYGEVGFRNIEQRMLHEVSELENVVISAGGGTPCYSDNLEWMLNNGYVVYLDCSMKELIVRLTHNHKRRPMLKDLEDAEAFNGHVRELFNKREPIYQQANLKLSVDGKGIEVLIDEIVIQFEKE